MNFRYFFFGFWPLNDQSKSQCGGYLDFPPKKNSFPSTSILPWVPPVRIPQDCSPHWIFSLQISTLRQFFPTRLPSLWYFPGYDISPLQHLPSYDIVSFLRHLPPMNFPSPPFLHPPLIFPFLLFIFYLNLFILFYFS